MGYYGGGGPMIPFSPANYDWLNSDMFNVVGLWDGSTYGGIYADNFGSASAVLPAIADGDIRYRPQWTQSPLGSVGSHGSSILKTFGAAGVPAKPVDVTSSYGLMGWAVSPGVPGPMFRFEYGLPAWALRQFYEAGYKTLSFSGYLLCLTPTPGTIIDQNLGVINLADINVNGGTNLLQYQLIGPPGFVMKSDTTYMTYSRNAAWQPWSFEITLDATDYKSLGPGGRDGLQLQLITGATGHPRLIYLFKPTRISR